MRASEYNELPNMSTGLKEVGDKFVPEQLHEENVNRANGDSPKRGDTVRVLQVAKVKSGLIINYEVKEFKLQ